MQAQARQNSHNEMSDGMHTVDQVTRQVTPANEPINLGRFCDLLQEHAHGSLQCNGADSVMLFGSTGVGKSTMLHLLAGAKFSFEAVELATDESVAGEFGTDTELQLVTQMKIAGCVIGKRFVFHLGIVVNYVYCG
jgi:ABC-type transport system involved in cytochrome bd biosynthesis fused ATPase/permease subunit